MTFDEFLNKYQEHIEGKIEANEGGRPITAEGGGSKGDNWEVKMSEDKQEELKLEEGEGQEQETIEKESLNLSKSRQKNDDMNKSKESTISNTDYKFEIPESCYMHIMKGNAIEKLTKKFYLIAHPYPLIEGEMLMF
mmetsp:Transcript_21639/g.20756  ORF Transcript_21639/g.20756 Transcript_21639/m.20756 type:complete len:137 (+) Transcript_21639:354-764(+)